METGQWIDGHQCTVSEGNYKVCEIAYSFSIELDSKELYDLMWRASEAMAVLHESEDVLTDVQASDELDRLATEAEEWLNENCALDNHWWGWDVGSFGLWEEENEG